ncbi:hypothetical protein C7M22_03707 [Bacillus velezensis]|uniref:hypothetical protein n=1 Tax=Bacillus amyloliquefaciens group TaxID=1938374 RepID=UPI0008DBC91B|nr:MULTISPECIES: hypothetical protein [Bacillus amyloliquefaciens group]APA02817.1 hypothetical protein BK055_09815 [Bacillus velezensis]MEC0403239.1 hypothetical protein [Bacillus velezensis]QHK65749.1 hypothetical protein C7M22_03707 [Bacillus velezensis]QHL98517.1 hypothetical protein C7M25_02743 [Bacillus velezensis]WJN56461.1 hypothetical protein QTN52_09195 [Bacillus velezensis]
MDFEKRSHHGTSNESAENIVKTHFNKSTGEHHWLGEGTYFFEDDVDKARDWAISEGLFAKPNKKYREYAIIESNIVCNIDEVLDIESKKEHEVIFNLQRQELINKIKREKIDVKGKWDCLDGRTFDGICDVFKFKVVKQPLFISDIIDREAKVFSRIPNCTVLCVKSLDCISNPQIIEKGDIYEHRRNQKKNSGVL